MEPPFTIQHLQALQDRGEALKFLYFWGHTPKDVHTIDKSCFSQWYPSSFIVDDVEYKTAEHWMMAQKALLFSDVATCKEIISCTKPGEAKALGRLIENFSDDIWNEHRHKIVLQGNLHKFDQHPALKDFLLSTGDRILVEASPVDPVWGIGMSADDPEINYVYKWKGLNLLGFALMEVRNNLW